MADDFAFTVTGLEPPDPAFAHASQKAKRAFWTACIPLVMRAYGAQLEAGIGADGDSLAPIAASTRKHRRSAITRSADPGAPPLIPAHALSRTNSLLRGRVLDSLDGIELYWLTDSQTGLNWGQVLAWHRDGSTRYPPRDVMGLSPQFTAEAQSGALAWWAARKKSLGVTDETKPGGPTQVTIGGQKYTIGGTTGPLTAQEIADAIKNGTFSGFRRRGPGGMPTPGLTPTPPPPPPPQPKHPKIPKLKTNEQLAAEAKKKADAAAAKAKAEAEARAKAEQEAALLAEMKRRMETALAKEKADAAAEAATMQPGDLRAEILAALKGLDRPSQKNKAITDLLLKYQSAEAVTGKYHGMTTEEDWRYLDFEGVRYHFPKVGPFDPTGDVNPIVSTLRGLTAVDTLPGDLTRHTRAVYFTSQSNKDDEYWNTKYGMTGEYAGATGGDGAIVVYRKEPIAAPRLAHEMGHNLATGVYGGVNPRGAYLAAMDSGESPVSDYAKVDPAEDFAEAMKLYIMDRVELKRVAPLRYAAIDALIGGTSHAG